MLTLAQTLFFGLGIGFVVSGIVSNVFQLVTDGKSVLHFPVTSDWRRLMMIGLLIFAGPHILWRAAARSLKIGDWPTSYIFGSFALGTAWSFVVGFTILHLFIA